MLKSLYLLIIFFSLAIICSAQTDQKVQQTSQPIGDDAIKINTSLINIPVIVSDKNGRYLPNLTGENFSIYENGVKQQLELFSADSLPFHVVLLVDTSGSLEESFQGLRTAAVDFISNIRDEDKVMLVSFADQVYPHTDFTSDKTVLKKAALTMNPGGNTRLNDALYSVSRNILKKVPGRKAVILLSDGIDTASGRSIEDACRELEESGALVYIVSYPPEQAKSNNFLPYGLYGPDFDGRKPRGLPPNAIKHPVIPFPHIHNFPIEPTNKPKNTIDRDNMPKLPSNGNGTGKGGIKQFTNPFKKIAYKRDVLYVSVIDYLANRVDATVFRAASLNSLAGPMQTIAEQLRHVYSLAYYPTNPVEKGGFRKIEVKLPKHDKKTKIRYKRGYNAVKADSVASTSF